MYGNSHCLYSHVNQPITVICLCSSFNTLHNEMSIGPSTGPADAYYAREHLRQWQVRLRAWKLIFVFPDMAINV